MGIEPRQIGGNRRPGLLQQGGRYGTGELIPLDVAHGTNVDAEAFVDVRASHEGKLRAAASSVEDDDGCRVESEANQRRTGREPAFLLA